MDAFSDRKNESIVVMSSAQVGKTEIVLNAIGYHVDQDPAPILLLQPTVEMSEAFSKDRVAPMIRDTPALTGKVKESKSRDSGNTILHKTFDGGHLTMAGANSPAGLASRPIRIVLADEVDRYPPSAGKEGDPVELAIKRTERFWNRRVGMFSTPTVEGQSRIAAAYEQTDKRQFWVPCPDCGHLQVLVWAQVKWHDKDPETAHYECIECHSKWTDSARWKAVSRGEWRASAPFNGSAGFHIWEAYAPAAQLRKIVKSFLKARKNPDQYKTWVNTTLGETFKERGDAPEWKQLYERRETWAIATCPLGALFLTAGVDVQADRIEVSVYAWGRGKQSWCIDHLVFASSRTTEQPVWTELTDFLSRSYPHESGLNLHIQRLAIDTGFNTQQVYAWLRHQSGHCIGIKGYDTGAAILGQPKAVDLNHKGKKTRRSVKIWPLNVSMLKEEFYGWLKLQKPTDEALLSGEKFPNGYCHFPQFGEDFFKQLTAEELVLKEIRGYKIPEWRKTGERNEALDCRNYARAAAAHVGIDRFAPRDWTILEASLQPAETAEAEAARQPPSSPVIPAPPSLPAPVQQPTVGTVQAQPQQRPGQPYQPVRSKFMGR